jgi:hypothetical protein
MSVVATVKVYDGIVLGAESMTQLTAIVNGIPQLIKSYENAQKLFQVGNFPIGVLTYGAGNLGRRSIESFVHEFSRAEEARQAKAIKAGQVEPVDVEQTAKRFFGFMKGQYEQAFGAMAPDQMPGLGFIVAGYSDGEHLASEWEFLLPQSAELIRVRPQDGMGASWRGVAAPFSRVMFGIDPSLEQQLAQAGASPAEIQRFKTVVSGLATQVPFDGMPLQDAVGYCRFIIQTTIGWCTYAAGAALCGGPIRLATITRGAGFEWVTPPKHYVEGEKHGH